MHLQVALCLPRDAETVSLIRGVVRNALTAFGVTDHCIDDIEIALSEACTNVIEHAGVDDDYEVDLEVDDEHCEISVRNAGDGFDASALDGVMPDVESARGRGVSMMHALMDSVAFTSEPEAGTIVHLVKKLMFKETAPLIRMPRAGR